MLLHCCPPPPFFCVLLCREEISTLSRHASFRRMNSVSTDPRGAVLLLNYSLCIKHTAASLSYIFLPRLPNPIPACQALWHHWSKSEHCWSQMSPTYSGILEIHWRFWVGFFLDCTMFICLELNSGAPRWFLIYHHSLLGLLFTV